MAKEETVAVPVSVLERMQSRLDALEQADRVRQEQAENPRARILDAAHEAWKQEASLPAAVRTQKAADKKFDGPQKFRVWLDSSTEEGRPGPKIGEHPPIVIAAHSPEEAQGRYLMLCGIKKHDYRLRAELVSAA